MYWNCYEENTRGSYTPDELQAFYDETVDKNEYPTFDAWKWDAERSGFIYRHEGEPPAPHVEFVQAYVEDFDEWGADSVLRVEWCEVEETGGIHFLEYAGIQERPITPTVTHLYDLNGNAPRYMGDIVTEDEEEYCQLLAELVSKWTGETCKL